MRALSSSVPALTCAGVMVLAMWLIMRVGRATGAPPSRAADDHEVARLQAEIAELRGDLDVPADRAR